MVLSGCDKRNRVWIILGLNSRVWIMPRKRSCQDVTKKSIMDYTRFGLLGMDYAWKCWPLPGFGRMTQTSLEYGLCLLDPEAWFMLRKFEKYR